MEFSTRSIHQLIRGQGEKRVSKSAAGELGEVLEDLAEDLAEEAVEIAEKEGYKTVKDKHLQRVLRK